MMEPYWARGQSCGGLIPPRPNIPEHRRSFCVMPEGAQPYPDEWENLKWCQGWLKRRWQSQKGIHIFHPKKFFSNVFKVSRKIGPLKMISAPASFHLAAIFNVLLCTNQGCCSSLYIFQLSLPICLSSHRTISLSVFPYYRSFTFSLSICITLFLSVSLTVCAFILRLSVCIMIFLSVFLPCRCLI